MSTFLTWFLKEASVKELLFKVVRSSNLMGTPSIFESLILKQFLLYCKTIITHGLHLD